MKGATEGSFLTRVEGWEGAHQAKPKGKDLLAKHALMGGL